LNSVDAGNKYNEAGSVNKCLSHKFYLLKLRSLKMWYMQEYRKISTNQDQLGKSMFHKATVLEQVNYITDFAALKCGVAIMSVNELKWGRRCLTVSKDVN
jgi:hypothetical protein